MNHQPSTIRRAPSRRPSTMNHQPSTIRRRRLLAAAALVALILVSGPAGAEPTPPIAPRIQETPLPPPVELPPPPTLPADVPNRPLSADEAARIALHNQPNVTVAAAGVSAAAGRVQQARSAMLPNVAATAIYTHQQVLSTQSGGGTPSGGGAGGTTSVVAAPGYQG